MMKTKSVGALTMRGFMICLHQMHDFMPWFGPNLRGIETILDAMADSKLNRSSCVRFRKKRGLWRVS